MLARAVRHRVVVFMLLTGCADEGTGTDTDGGGTMATEDSGDHDVHGDPSSGATTGDPTSGDASATGGHTTTGDATTDGESSTGDGRSSTGEGSTTGDPDDAFVVGIDVRDIDPTPRQLGSVYLGGFGAPFARGTATGIHDSIYARSFAIGFENEGVVFAVVDAVGMGNQWTRAIREQAASATGLPPERIIVATTHTHGGPDFQGLWGGVGDSYGAAVVEQTVGSIAAAWEARVPADLSVSSSTALNDNRRGWGFTDDSVVALQAHSRLDASLIATVVAFAAHPVIVGASNRELTRDYCGYTVDALEATSGAPVMFFNGILGDVSPSTPPGEYPDDFARAEAYGTHIAEEAAEALETAVPVEPGMYADDVEWTMPVDNALFNLAGQLGILEYDFMQNGLSSSVLTQSTYVRLGTQVQIVALPGEALTRNGLPVKEAMTAPFQVALGNAGDALGYFVPSDEWETGLNDNYEESVSLGQSAGDTTRDEILGMIESDPF